MEIATKDALPLAPAPELVIGLVGPIGVDLELVTSLLSDALRGVGYSATSLRVTALMREVPTDVSISDGYTIESFQTRIRYANRVCELIQRNDAMAILAISAIRELRRKEKGDPEKPIPGRAYIIRQFKRPAEIKLLRSVYGRQFIQISVYAPQEYRIKRIFDEERASRSGLVDEVDAKSEAHKLVLTDDKEEEFEEGEKKFGQNVQDAFPLGDVFVNSVDRASCKETLERFVSALFGNNEITPTHDEYGMYIAKSAALRSAALSRQVGAAIFSQTGEIITMGCNEVPKSGGGTYWTKDTGDRRDIVQGFDPNDQKKNELLADLLNRLKDGHYLSKDLSNIDDPNLICKKVLDDDDSTVKDSKVMDLLEFGRDIHAEMSAICDAARKGVPVSKATLYSTTFPCHMCAKHIVAVGISKVVYLEPYPKSYARELHADSIKVEGAGPENGVDFVPFIGISPYRYRDLFEKGRRKYGGIAQPWHLGVKRPMIEVYYPSYFEAEVHVVTLIQDKLDELRGRLI